MTTMPAHVLEERRRLIEQVQYAVSALHSHLATEPGDPPAPFSAVGQLRTSVEPHGHLNADLQRAKLRTRCDLGEGPGEHQWDRFR